MGISVDEAAFHTSALAEKPYFVGKPNPLMLWTALGILQTGPAEAFMVGDRMDTDIIAGTEAGMKTILVLSGVTTPGADRNLPLPPHPYLRRCGAYSGN